MHSTTLIASVAAAMLTLANIGVIASNLPSEPVTNHVEPISVVDLAPITVVGPAPIQAVNLAPIQVIASAEDMRAAALLPATSPNLLGSSTSTRAPLGNAVSTRLLESAVAMPYYSFGHTLGRTNKE